LSLDTDYIGVYYTDRDIVLHGLVNRRGWKKEDSISLRMSNVIRATVTGLHYGSKNFGWEAMVTVLVELGGAILGGILGAIAQSVGVVRSSERSPGQLPQGQLPQGRRRKTARICLTLKSLQRLFAT
jgi:hypothetical protein